MAPFNFKSLLATASVAVLLAQQTYATPLIAERDEAAQAAPAAAPTDTQVLNFALTLEYLENAFYAEALNKFNDDSFKKAGFPAFARGRFNQIKMHESTHVDFLRGALAAGAVEACAYKFPLANVNQFAVVSATLETVGASAYLGAAKLISNKDYLTAAGSILSVESRQSSWVQSSALHLNPWSTAFDVPLTLSQAYTLAAAFITSCPAGNAAKLPALTAFPTLTIKNGSYSAGSTVTLQYPNSGTDLANNERYLAVLTGLGTVYTRIAKDGKVKLPELQGTAYGIVTSNGAAVNDGNTIAGPVVLMFPFPSYATNAE